MKKLSLQLEDHPFFKEVLSDLQPVFQKYKETDTPFSAFSELDQYILLVFKWLMRIWDCFETLEHARVYLSYYRSNKRYEEARIGRVQHMNYHYYYYAITVVRTMDIALILTNNAFRLGTPDELCRFSYISENSWVRSARVDKMLKQLESVVKPWRDPRNLFVHRGAKIDSQPLNYVEAWDLLIRDDSSIANIIPHSKIKLLYKSEISRVVKEFDKTETRLFSAIVELLSGLLPIYSFWRKVLK